MEAAEAEKRVGTTLRNKWKLERLLGVGGMAAVYVAAHKIGRFDAIKILHPEIARSHDLRARFELEAHVANRFKHPGAVEIRDIDKTEDGSPFLVMELLEGEPLSNRARRGEIGTEELLRYIDELLDVLAAAHKQGIVHRDIKLDNLFIHKDGSLKVLDFGIARVRDGANARTQLGATLGTAPYMPPEQVCGLEVDGRADVFAVGATMFRVLSNRRIHEAATESELLTKMATEAAPPLASILPSAPRDLCLVVDRALRFRTEDRYPDAATMQADVRALRKGTTPPHAIARLMEADSPASLPTAVKAGSGAAAAATVAVKIVPMGLQGAASSEGFAHGAGGNGAGPLSAQAPSQAATRAVALAAEPTAAAASWGTEAPVAVQNVAQASVQQANMAGAVPSAFTPNSSAVPTGVAPADLNSTLKSEGISRHVAISALPSVTDIPVQSAPPRSNPYVPLGVPNYAAPSDTKRLVQLLAFGGAFLVLGIIIVIAAWPSSKDKTPTAEAREPYDRTDAPDTARPRTPAPTSPRPASTPASKTESSIQTSSPKSESPSSTTSPNSRSDGNSRSDQSSKSDQNRGDSNQNSRSDQGRSGNPGGSKGDKGGKGKGKGHGKGK